MGLTIGRSTTLFWATQQIDALNRVTRITLADDHYWDYGYDSMNQVTSGVKRDPAGTALPGYTFGYGFDTIGNRESATREATTEAYTPNAFNQIESINHAGLLHLIGSADAAATLTLNGHPTTRTGELFYHALSGNNTFAPITLAGTLTGAGHNGTDAVAMIEGENYIPSGPTGRTHDESGNLVEDARWLYKWDAENRLVRMETRPALVTAGAPHRRLTFEYDSQSRRTRKTVETWDGTEWQTDEDIRFLWNDWLLTAELRGSTLEPIRTYTWSHDISGSRDMTGGVGGLARIRHHQTDEVTVPLYGPNGNVFSYWNIDQETTTATFEYGPFGELIAASGAEQDRHRFRFSSKYEDSATGYLYYGFRFYDPETGRWLNRDPIQEEGGLNVYGIAFNNLVQLIDLLGAIALEFNAFIPGSVGEPIQGLRGTWAREPGPMNPWYFRTDGRDFGGGSSRIRSIAEIDISKIGNLEGSGQLFTSLAGPTTRVRRNVLLGGFGANTEFIEETLTSEISDEERIRDLSPCKSEIRIKAWGNYPFVSYSPDINYTATWILTREPSGQTTIEFKGSHNLFPNYEGLVDGENIYKYETQSSGPGIWNLGIWWTRINASPMTL